MNIQKIKIENFRNYHEEEVVFHNKVNVIVGDNAQGKTNLLESIYVSSLGRSFRTTKDKEMIRFEEPFARILATYNTEEHISKLKSPEKSSAVRSSRGKKSSSMKKPTSATYKPIQP